MIFTDSDDFSARVLQKKKDRVIEIVKIVCKTEGLSIPKVNFDGCPEETDRQLGHYHPDKNKICISEFQLDKLKSMRDVETTTIHELAHMIEPKHGGWHSQTMALFRSKAWKPPRGLIHIDGDTVNRESAEIRADPERNAYANDDSDYIKFIEGRLGNKYSLQAQKEETFESRKSPNMAKEDMDKIREKLGIDLSDKSHIKSKQKEKASKRGKNLRKSESKTVS